MLRNRQFDSVQGHVSLDKKQCQNEFYCTKNTDQNFTLQIQMLSFVANLYSQYYSKAENHLIGDPTQSYVSVLKETRQNPHISENLWNDLPLLQITQPRTLVKCIL